MPRPPNARPDRTPPHLKWARVAVEEKQTIKGWIAGPVFGCEGHPIPSFKPCHKLFTSGRRECPWCALPQFSMIRYQGYLPMYDERMKQIVICINLDNTVRVDGLEGRAQLHTVTATKAKGKTAPINLNFDEWTVIKPTTTKKPQDIVPWLVNVLWKKEGLQEWGAEDKRISVLAEREPGPVTLEVRPKDDAEATPEQIEKLRAAGMGKLAERFVSEGRVVPSTNGNHKPPKKG